MTFLRTPEMLDVRDRGEEQQMGDQEQDSSDLQELANTLRDTIANLDALIEQRAAELTAKQMVPVNRKLAAMEHALDSHQQELMGLAYLSRFLPQSLAMLALGYFRAVSLDIPLDPATKRQLDYDGDHAWSEVAAVVMQHPGESPHLGCPICHRQLEPAPKLDDTTPLGAILAYAKTSICNGHHLNKDLTAMLTEGESRNTRTK